MMFKNFVCEDNTRLNRFYDFYKVFIFLLLDQPVESKNDHKKSEFANVLSDELMLYKRGNVYILENSTYRFLLEANQRH